MLCVARWALIRAERESECAVREVREVCAWEIVDLSVAIVMSVCVIGSGVEVGGANLMILWAGEKVREGRSRER